MGISIEVTGRDTAATQLRKRQTTTRNKVDAKKIGQFGIPTRDKHRQAAVLIENEDKLRSCCTHTFPGSSNSRTKPCD